MTVKELARCSKWRSIVFLSYIKFLVMILAFTIYYAYLLWLTHHFLLTAFSALLNKLVYLSQLEIVTIEVECFLYIAFHYWYVMLQVNFLVFLFNCFSVFIKPLERIQGTLKTDEKERNEEDADNFFGVPTFLTVSGQLHLEVASGLVCLFCKMLSILNWMVNAYL